jgi:D-xylose transport system substrate-binding protein
MSQARALEHWPAVKLRLALVVLSCVLSIATGLLLSRSGGGSPASAAKPAGTVLIGLSMDTLKEARWQRDRDLFVKRAGELGARVLVQSANSDDSAQVSDVEKLITNGVDVLVIIPHDGKAMAKAVNMANDAKIPVIAYDRIIKDSALDLYMSFDNVRVGELQARYLVDHLPTPGKGKIVRIHGSKTDNNAFQFKQGQDNVLGPYIARGDIEVVHEDWADDWKPENAKRILNAAISKTSGKFDGVLATNDGTAGGAVQALTEEGMVQGKVVTGQDAELVACQRIAGGSQSMTIYKPLHKLARAAAEVAVQLATKRIVVAGSRVNNGKVDVPAVLSDVVTVTRDNLRSTVIADGFHSEADVYRGIPAAGRPASP